MSMEEGLYEIHNSQLIVKLLHKHVLLLFCCGHSPQPPPLSPLPSATFPQPSPLNPLPSASMPQLPPLSTPILSPSVLLPPSPSFSP